MQHNRLSIMAGIADFHALGASMRADAPAPDTSALAPHSPGSKSATTAMKTQAQVIPARAILSPRSSASSYCSRRVAQDPINAHNADY